MFVKSFGDALSDGVRIINMSMTWRVEMKAKYIDNLLKIFENLLLKLKCER